MHPYLQLLCYDLRRISPKLRARLGLLMRLYVFFKRGRKAHIVSPVLGR